MEHHFELTGTWHGGLMGEGRIASGGLETKISVPASLQGPGHGSNPEELLLAAASTCYLITLGAILERRGISAAKIELSSVGTVFADKGTLRFQKIVHRPRITLPAGSTEEQIETARTATERAEKACMISQSLRGNVEFAIEPTVGIWV
jgi:peroxiredoxin-like protein